MYLKFGKPLLDTFLAILIFLVMLPVMVLITITLYLYQGGSPFFFQDRIGQHAKVFRIIKFRTITSKDIVLPFSKFLRRSKLDELPQLVNIIKQDMSFVGPRPDIPGYYDQLPKEFYSILELKPGLTGYASIEFSNEEELLAMQDDIKSYNDNIIFPQKLKLNLKYRKELSFLTDIKLICLTLLVVLNLNTNGRKF